MSALQTNHALPGSKIKLSKQRMQFVSNLLIRSKDGIHFDEQGAG